MRYYPGIKLKVIIIFCLFTTSNIFSQKCYRVYVNITADYTFYEMSGFDDEFTESMMNDSFNFASQTFQQYGIYLIKGDFDIIKNENNDPFRNIERRSGKTNVNDLFDVMNETHETLGEGNFGTNPYTSELGFTYDIDVLFTGNIYDISPLERLGGLARRRSLYSDRSYVLISHVIPNQFNIIPSAFAHEIGHVFGGEHCDAIRSGRFRNCVNNDSSPAPVTESLMKSGFNDDEVPTISPNNLLTMSSLLNDNHYDYVSRGNASPFANSSGAITFVSDKGYQVEGVFTIDDMDLSVSGNSTTLLLKSAQVIKNTGVTRFIPQGSGKIMLISDNSLNDYCLSGASSFNKSASLKTDEQDMLKTPKALESQIERVRLFPNPVTNLLNIDVTLTEKSLVRAAVYSLSGKLMFDLLKNNELSKGNHQKQFDVSKLALGNYIIKIDTEKGSKSYQIIKE